MGFYDDKENIKQYIDMAKGFDGRELIKTLHKYLKKDSTLLELGMGPGVDLEILDKTYIVTGSDLSDVFLEMYRKKHPKADLIKLDAQTLDTPRRFDGIYSNKVLHHLSPEGLSRSLERQKEILHGEGIAFHTFWLGEGSEEMKDLFFQYYRAEELKKIAEQYFDYVKVKKYTEMEEDDSLLLICKNNK